MTNPSNNPCDLIKVTPEIAKALRIVLEAASMRADSDLVDEDEADVINSSVKLLRKIDTSGVAEALNLVLDAAMDRAIDCDENESEDHATKIRNAANVFLPYVANTKNG